MSALSEIDPYFIKSISALHSYEQLHTGEPLTLQLLLEEAIYNKTGVTKNFTPLLQSVLKQTNAEDNKNIPTIVIEDNKTTSSSDNELELDLLKEDLMCVVCKQMDVGARNRLLECSDCHCLYHQDCHTPIVSSQDSDNTWSCSQCKETKKAQKSESSKSSSQHRSSSGSYKSGSGSSKGGSKSSSKSSSSKSSSSASASSSSSRTPATPNINIINADKRIQIMKKKAASKIHEKRKPMR